MRYVVDHDIHIHTGLSLCSLCEEQTPESILKYAEDVGYKTICLTDHFWDETVEGSFSDYHLQNYAHIKESLPLPKSDKVRFLFGAECDMNKDKVIGLSKQVAEELDFIIISTTHMGKWQKDGSISNDDYDSVEARARLWGERFEAVLDSDLPFHKVGVAHLGCSLLCQTETPENYPVILSLITDETATRCFTKAAEKGMGVELNYYDILRMKEYKRLEEIFRIAKKCGCKFYFGSDAHKPFEFEGSKDAFEYAVDLLGLTEDDKFRVGE